MKNVRNLLIAVLILLSAAIFNYAEAAGMYVREGSRSAVREAPMDGSRILGMAESNDYLEIFEVRGDWSRIKTPGAVEGWVQNRFLSRQMPKSLIIDQLNEKVKALTDENQVLQEENTQLKKENRERSFKMSGVSKEVEDIRKKYDTLEQESSHYLDLKKRYEELQIKSKEAGEKMEGLTRENSRLKTSERLIFTLIGGGFIIIGLVIGTLAQYVRTGQKKGGYKF